MIKSNKLKFLLSDAFFYSDYERQELQAVNVDEIKAIYVKKIGDHLNAVATTKNDEQIVLRSIFSNDTEARMYVSRLVDEINGGLAARIQS